MTEPDIQSRLTRILVEHLGVSLIDVTDDAHITLDLGADSLDTVELVMAIEEEFGIEYPDELIEEATYHTVKQERETIAQLLSQSAA